MASQSAAVETIKTRTRTTQSALLLVVAALACAAAMWGFIAFVLVPHQTTDAAATGAPRGNLSDLYPRWLGSREMLHNGTDPYSRAVTQQIQLGYYGVVLDPTNPAHPKDQQGFAYPVYVAFLLAPLINLPFDAVQDGFGWLLLLVTALAAPLWLMALRLRLALPVIIAVALLVVGSFPGVQGYSLQQLTLLDAFFLAAAMALVARGKLFAGGALLAVATIKPQLVAPLLIGLCIWTLRDLRGRQNFLWGFGAAMALLLAGSELLMPGWIPKFVAALGDYQRYTAGVSLLNTFFGGIIGSVLAALLILLVLPFWLLAGREKDSGPAFGEAVAMTICVTLLIIPTWAPYNQVLLLPALLLLLHHAARAWREGGRWTRYAYLLTGLTLAWPWVAAALLVLAAGVVSVFGSADVLAQVRQNWTWPFFTSLFIPIAVLLALIAVLHSRITRDAWRMTADGNARQ